MSFETDISNFTKKTGIKTRVVFRRLALEAFTGVLQRSPVDTGRFRASNRVSLNVMDPTVEPEDSGSTMPSVAGEPPRPEEIGDFNNAMYGFSPWRDQSIHISNSLHYAIELEHGKSQQAPDGIYGLTFQDLVDNLDRAVNSVKNTILIP